jgi:hypothetical protein
VDRFGLPALIAGAGVLAVISVTVLLGRRSSSTMLH